MCTASEHGTVTTSPCMTEPAQLLRRVGLFDATMIVMGGIVGAGIFINPYVVARQVHTPVLDSWGVGGGRRGGDAGRFHLRRTGGAHAECWRAVCVSARRVSSACRIFVWMGAAAGHPDRRHGGGHDHLRAIFSGTHWLAGFRKARRGRHHCAADDCELPGRESWAAGCRAC